MRTANDLKGKTCGIRCKEHDKPCHVAHIPKGMSETVGGMFRITHAGVPHNHSHMIPTKDGSLLAHTWNNGVSRYAHAEKGTTTMKRVTKKEADEWLNNEGEG